MAIQVSVIGSGAEHEARAEEVGRLLAGRGCTVVCGGREVGRRDDDRDPAGHVAS